MADAALGVVVETVLKTVVSLAAKEINLAWGVKKELEKLAQELEMIQALLSDAQSKQLTSNAVQLWLQRLGSVALDAQIVLDEFGYQVLRQTIECRKRDKVRAFCSSSNPLIYRLKIAHKIKAVMSSLREVYAQSNELGLQKDINLPPPQKEDRATDPFVDVSEIVGRDDDASKVINMLVGSDYPSKLPVIAILGMGGQGKTTLAKLVYNNDDKVQSYFEKRVWVCVSDDFNVETLLAEMLQSLTRKNHQLTNVEALVGDLKEELSGKRYLLVLDDVWDEKGEKWDRMRRCLLEVGGSKGSKVLITTRSEQVANTMQTSKQHELQVLSEEQSWNLFEKWAFADGGGAEKPQALVDIGRKILKRCGGVPLAIRVMGGLLYSKNYEEWSRIERSELWGEGKGVLSTIKLSYDHLPSLALKQCFAYCAIFQKDTRMQKDELIQLWMAQGLLNPAKGSQMEDVGSKYFYILRRSSLLEDAGKDYYNDITYYKMHDLVHDVSLQVSENYCFHVKDWKDVQGEIKAVHLSITASEGGLSKSLKDIVPSKLRTLHLEGCYVLEDLFENLKCLNVLIFKDEKIEELPNSIGKMKHLRFLDISSCQKIRRLPNSVTELYYLQTLKVCILDEVPKDFWKLINLRHFYAKNEFLIPGISQLKNLQTLPAKKCDGCQIEELEHLDNLKGVLRIYGLQNVSTRESALKSNLSKKSEVQTLYLHWNWLREEDCDDRDVMEGLKPHSNLKSLKIMSYQSPTFPSWMTTRNDLKLLVKLILSNLKKCEQLPSLGDLPCLEHLEILGSDSVRCIGEEFYGWSNLDWVKKSNCSNGSQITLFPLLKVFELGWMRNVVEWSDAIVPAHANSSVKVFPVLEEMDIFDLPQLCSFPNLGCLPKLQRLRIKGCPSLSVGSNWNEFGRVGKLKIEDERAALTCHYLPSLRKVIIVNCDEFAAPFCSLKILAPLEDLEIWCNHSLWPKDLHHLINLRSFRLGGSQTDLSVHCFPFPYSYSISNVTEEDVQYFPSLTALTLDGDRLPNVTSLSDQIQYLTSLRDLTIRSFYRLEALPEWLGNLTSLQNLKVSFCENLKQLPSAEAFGRLTNLQCLEIGISCDNLKKACTQGSGSEWPKIAPLIPNLEVRFY